MNKIDFKNLPDTTTPLSAENFNLLQDNVEDAISVENQEITNYVDSKVQDTIDYIDTLNNCSTTEQRVGTFDGKPLYRKLYKLNIGSSNDLTVAHNLTNLGVYWLTGFIFGGGEGLPLAYYFSSTDWCRTWINATNFRFKSGAVLTNRVIYAIVNYTKSTD